MSSLSLSLKQPMSGRQSNKAPLIVQLPSVTPQLAQVGTPMTATAGLYEARFGGTLTVGQTWLVGNTEVAIGTDFTPRPEDAGRRLRYREIVQESGPQGRTTTAVALDTTVQAAKPVWNASVAGAQLTINASPGPRTAPQGTVSGQVITISG